ncbi:MAG: GNAT family N-acetyltransferase [Acidobacteria bacterium]|nr:GNAT family N-acetyltransferase [Acidobacteriota bacterium]
MLVRPATGADAVWIVEFNQAMAWETEHKRLDAAVLSRGVERLIEQPAMGFYLVAELEGTIAGCLLVTTEWTDWRDGVFWWIQSVYVAPAFRRRGVYRALYAHVKSMAAANPEIRGLRLYVERDNHSAQQTYRRLGMAETAYRIFEEEFPR